MQLLRAEQAMAADEKLRAEIEVIVEAPAGGGPRVLNLIQVFENAGLDRLKSAVKRPLKHLKAACYYGCLLVAAPGGHELRRCRAAALDGGRGGRHWRDDGRMELQDRMLRRRHDHGQSGDRAGVVQPHSGERGGARRRTAWWWPAPCAM